MNNNPDEGTAVFDKLADSYDSDFSETEIGRLLRTRTHHQMTKFFSPGNQILEINCGTGEDAVYLAAKGMNIFATDVSEKMISRAVDKAGRLGLDKNIKLNTCRFEALDSVLQREQVFDGIISNFGGLNCADDLPALAEELACRVKPGGYLFFCIMGRIVPWEWVLLGLRGDFKRIRDRFRGECSWRGQKVRYYRPGQVIRAFLPYCRVERLSGLGFLLPPTYASALVSGTPGIFRVLNFIEAGVQSFPVIPYLSDHFMLILCRK